MPGRAQDRCGLHRSARGSVAVLPNTGVHAPGQAGDQHSLEGLVAQHLRAWLAYRGDDAELFFWRTRSGVEVDFVVYGAAGFWAIEVKNAARISPRDLRGLETFVADYPLAEVVMLYRGTQRERRRRVWIVPIDEFLKDLRPTRDLLVHQ